MDIKLQKLKDKEKLKIRNVKCFKINQSIKKYKANQIVGMKWKWNQITDGGRELGGGGWGGRAARTGANDRNRCS
jgi:hypothetical protein